MSKELVFKLVMDADVNKFIQNTKQSEETVRKLFDEIQKQSQNAGQATDAASKSIENLIPKGTPELASTLTQKLNEATKQIKDAGTGAGETAKNFTEFGQKSEKALDQIKADLDQAKLKLQQFSQTNATPEDIAKAQAQVDALEKEVAQADQAFDNFTNATDKANQELNETSSASDKARKGFDNIKQVVGLLGAALAAVGIGMTVKDLINLSDATQQINARLRNATDSVEDYNKVQERMLELANATYRPLEEAQEVYLATAGTMKSLGFSTDEILNLTDSLSLSFTHNATRADQAQAAQDALAKSMAKGRVDADAWMSIITGADNVVGDLARTTGRTEEEIRKLGANGQISVSELTQALIESRERNLELANAMENSTADALQVVKNGIRNLVSEMNEQYSISSRLAEVIQNLGGDLSWLAVLFDDAMSAVEALSAEFKDVDPSIFTALKEAISSAYDAVKQIITGAYELGQVIDGVIIDSINNMLAVLSSFTGDVSKAGEQVSFFTRIGQGLSVALGVMSDGFYGLRMVVGALAGVFYSLAEAANFWMSVITFGDVSKQFEENADKMAAKAKAHFDEVDRLGFEFESQAKKRLDRAIENEDQKNARILAENKKALDELLAIQEEEGANNEKLQSRKLKAVTDFVAKSIAANDGVIDSTLEMELAQKGYFATVDNGGKVVVTKLTEQEQATAAATLEIMKQKVAFTQATESGKTFGVDVEAATGIVSKGFNDNSSKLDAFIEQLQSAGITGKNANDMIYQAWQKWLSEAKNTAEIDKAKQKLMELGVAGQVSGDQINAGFRLADTAAKDLNPTLNAAREAGKALGIDIDKTTNIMSQGFLASSGNLDTLKQKLGEAGITGNEAANTLYKGWEAWLAKADSKVELDAAQAKLQEMAREGVISTKQLEAGMGAVKAKTEEVGMAADGTAEAFKRLGIQTKEQLSLAADSAIADFNKIKASGQATEDGLRQAAERTLQAALASGDQQRISIAKTQAAQQGLTVQIDETGKATVQSMAEAEAATQRVAKAAGQDAVKGYKDMEDASKSAGDAADQTAEKADKSAKKMQQSAASILAELEGYSRKQTDLITSTLQEAGFTAEEVAYRTRTLYKDMFQAVFDDFWDPMSYIQADIETREDRLRKLFEDNAKWKASQVALEERRAIAAENTLSKYENIKNNAQRLAELGYDANVSWQTLAKEGLSGTQSVMQKIKTDAADVIKSAQDSALSFLRSVDSIREEFLKATGQEKEALSMRFTQRRQQLALEHEMLKVQITAAKITAQQAGLSTDVLDKAMKDATAGFNEAKTMLAELEKMEAAKIQESKKVDEAKKVTSATESSISKANTQTDSPITSTNIDMPIAPEININVPSIDVSSESQRTVRVELVNGNQTTYVDTNDSGAQAIEAMMRELEQAKRRY